jgi:hypothetical protein
VAAAGIGLDPPGVGAGKSHVAQALAHLAIRAGAEARFTKTSRVLAHLAGARADRTWDKRLAELTRPAVLVLDDFGMRELAAPQADDLYELITERAGKSLILTSNRAPQRDRRKKAIIVVTHALIVIIWHVLATGKTYHELGEDYFTRRQDPEKETARLIAKLQALGHQVTLTPAA